MKVIVITRDKEYPENCKARKEFDKVSRRSGKYLNEYVEVFYKDAVSSLFHLDPNVVEQEYKTLFPQKNPSFEEFQDFCETANSDNLAEEFYKNKVHEPLQDNLKDCNPYAEFKYNDDDVYFVFMNEIYRRFFSDLRNPEHFFVDDKHRKNFIEAICKDCGIINSENIVSDKNNTLLIHDKELGKNGEKCLLYENYWCDTQDKDEFRAYEKYFSTIKYFQHNGGIFESIKDLVFVLEEEKEEARILRECVF